MLSPFYQSCRCRRSDQLPMTLHAQQHVMKPNQQHRYFIRLACLFAALFLGACQPSQPTTDQIQRYIEDYQVAHDYKVISMDYQVEPDVRGEAGNIRVSGKLGLLEPLYMEDLGNKLYRERVEKMLRRNRFSDREISHEIYDRVIRASARVADRENEYYTFLKEEYAPGYAINFSADLKYTKGGDGYLLDGLVNYPKLQGARLVKFTNPVVDDTKLVERAVEAVLAEQARYRELMKASSAILSRLWDNEHGLVVWNRKIPYLGNENLSSNEQAQLQEYSTWRGVYRISNIKPVQFNTPRSSNFYELGTYTTEGIATCLRQTGFARELEYPKADFGRYCEFGKQYPIEVRVASVLNETNEFEASVEFDIAEASTGKLIFKAPYFQREENELARYSDQQLVLFLEQPFELGAHNRATFRLLKSTGDQQELLRLEYSGGTEYSDAGFDDRALDIFIAAGTDSTSDNAISGSVSENAGAAAAEVGDAARSNPEAVKHSEAQIELIKAIQSELKRLNVYTARIDGIAGEQTYWAMDFVHMQLGESGTVKPTQEFLIRLQETPITAIVQPSEPQEEEVVVEQPVKKKTLGSWFSGLFKKKKEDSDD